MSAESLCRLCLKSSSKTVEIFSSDIPLLIETLTSIKVKIDDGLPPLSCEDCISDLYAAHKVRNRIIKSDNHLKKQLRQIEVIEPDRESACEDQKPAEECINFSFRNDHDESTVCTENSDDDDDIKEEYDEEDETIYNLIKGIKDEDCSEYINIKNTENISEGQLESSEIDIKDEDEHLKLPESSNKINETDDINKDFVVLTIASDIIDVDTSTDIAKYSCKVCKINLEHKKVFLHKSKHMKAKCKICDLIVRADNARKHLMIHKSKPQICDICGSSHKNKESLRVHMFNFHTKRPFYKCSHCNEEFRVSSHLWVHIRRVHTGVRPYQCDACGKGFITSFLLKTHKEMVHQHMRRYLCELCNRGYSSADALKTHKRQHTGELPYVCDICFKGFRQPVSLRTHMKSKHDITLKVNKPGQTHAQLLRREQRKNEKEQDS